jgi:hypothetical protein
VIRQVPFTKERWLDVILQPQQTRDHDRIDEVIETATIAFVDENDHCVACGGLWPFSESVAVAWAYIGADAGRHMVALLRAARSILKAAAWPEVRSGALIDFPAGNRLLHLLGFRPIAVLTYTDARVYGVFELVKP